MKKILFFLFFFIIAVLLCSVIGNYSGGALYLYLSGQGIDSLSWLTLYEAVHLPYKHPDFASAIWGSVLAVWIFFLPVLIAVITIWLYQLQKGEALYGKARFANDKELKPFHYIGDYK